MRQLSILLVMGMLTSTVMLSAQTLVLGYSESDGEPYYLVQNGNLVGGFFYELGQELGKQLGVSAVFKPYPRKRLQDALTSGEVDALLYENPDWGDNSRQYLWTKPYFVKKTQVLFLKQRFVDITSPTDLKGMRIGTILGYYYPTLDANFASGFFWRDDAQNLKQNLAKLQAGRIDALLASENELDWDVGLQNETLKRGSWVADSSPISMAVTAKSSLGSDKIIQAMANLQNEGAIQKIWLNYKR